MEIELKLHCEMGIPFSFVDLNWVNMTNGNTNKNNVYIMVTIPSIVATRRETVEILGGSLNVTIYPILYKKYFLKLIQL